MIHIPLLYETAVVAETLQIPTVSPTVATTSAVVVANATTSTAEPVIFATPLPTMAPVSSGTTIDIGGQAAVIASESMKMHPVFDWSPFLGLPLWLFISVGFVLLMLYVIMSWIFKLRRMSAVRGYVQAADKGTQEDMQVWIFGKTKKLTIECLKYWGGMIHFPANVKITKWRHPSIECTMKIGGITAVAVSEDYDQTRDFVSEIALCHAGEVVNRDHARLQRDLTAKGYHDVVIQPISCFKDYEVFGRRVLEMIYPDGIPIPSYSIFNHAKFRKYFPKGRDGDVRGGIFLRKAGKLRNYVADSERLLIKAGPLLLCVIFIAFLIFGAMYAPLVG